MAGRPWSLSQAALVGEQARGFDVGGHVGQGGLDHLEVGEALAELAALVGEGDAGVEAGLGHADCASRHARGDPGRGRTSRRLKPSPGAPSRAVARHAAILQGDADVLGGAVAQLFAGHRLALEAGGVGLDQEGADASVAQRRGPWLAKTMARWALVPLVIQIFSPLRT